MGIKGLKTYLLKKGISNPEVIPNGSKLLIDAYGFTFQVYHDFVRENKPGPQFGGQYSALADYYRNEIKKLMKTFKLEFYFDGSKSKQVKSATLSSREDGHQDLWLNLYKLCTSTSPRYRAKPINVDELPTAALVIETLRCIVSEFDDITVNECEYEADQEIALACKRNNDSGTVAKAYCYGNDTDFIAMADCPYIQFGSLEERNGQIRSNMVYYRSNVVRKLDLTEDQFVEFCILVGNDFTANDDRTRSEFDAFMVNINADDDIEDDDDDDDVKEVSLTAGGGSDALTSSVTSSIENIHIGDVNSVNQSILPDGNTPEVINKIRKLLIRKFSTEPNWKVSSSTSEDLQTGIVYSRAMYNLESLSEFPDEEDGDEEEDDDDDTIEVQLTSRQDCDASDWLKDSSQTFQGIHADVIKYLTDHSALYSFKPIHIKALELMHEKLVNGSESPVYEPFLPEWVDVVAANTYQLLCKKFIRFILRSETLSLGINDTPARLFDGYMFHCITSELDGSGEYDESNLIELPPVAQEPAPAPTVVGERVALPIDQHKDTILSKIDQDRVVIIHGETGCGKSSRLPLFLLENAEKSGQPCKIMISQPRRIAVHALMIQLKKTLGGRVGMRMGGGTREGDDDAQLTFVTTGYLVRFVAYHPEAFDNYTHLIIDEVHERSVDSDLLCYLSRKLLTTNSELKLILMSATVHTTLYKDYFSGEGYNYGDLQCLSVGRRRFENAISYVDDLVNGTCSGEVVLPSILLTQAKKIISYDPKKKDPRDPNSARELDVVLSAQYVLAKELIRWNAKRGTAVLVFVAGMKDINEFLEKFEEDEDYKVIAIHSDIPFEEQEQALVAAKPNEIKVIVATNAAESSLTLPDVDIVICLGTQKTIEYDASTHSVQLIKKWISKSSAIQRAGRTGRVRPGTVFRLYSKALYEGLEDHEQSEVNRKPLQDVILNLRGVLEDSADFDGVVPILQNLLQPPSMSNINKSFEHLFDSSMITAPTDEGGLTSIGRMAGHLPVDLSLGYLIAIGISLDLGPQAVVMASALSQPKSIFCLSSKMMVPDDYSRAIKRTFIGSNFFDDGVYSEPIMMLRIFLSWQELSKDERQSWLSKHNLHSQRLKQFILMSNHLADRVNRALRSGRRNSSIQQVDLETMSSDLSPSDINKLRLMLTWSSAGGIIEMKPYKFIHQKQLCTVTVDCGANPLTKDHIEPLFPKSLNWSMKSSERLKFSAKLSSSRESNTDMELLTVLAQSATDSESIPVISVMSKSGRNVIGFNVLIPLNNPKLRSEAELYLELLKTALGNFQLKVCGEILGNPVFTVRKGPKDKTLPRKVATMGQNTQIVAHSLHMLISEGNGDAEVISTNCRPSSTSLIEIFFGKDDVGSIKEDSLSTLYTLEFLGPVSKDSSGSLVTDVNIGMRILKSMVLSYNNDIKLLKTPKSKRSEVIKESPSTALKAGGGTGAAGPGKNKKTGKVDDNVMLAVLDIVPNSSWKCHPFCWSQSATLSLDKAIPARLPRQSLQSVAMPFDDHPLYGVTQKVLVTVSAPIKVANCDGVTLLPPGKKWLQLALLCLGKYSDAYQNLFGISSSLATTDLEMASDISKKIADIQSSPVQSNDALIELVDDLFSRWCDGTAGTDDDDDDDDDDGGGDDDDGNADKVTTKKSAKKRSDKSEAVSDKNEAIPPQSDQEILDEVVQLIQRQGPYKVNTLRAFLKMKSGGNQMNYSLLKRIKALLMSDRRVVYHYDRIYENGEIAWNKKCYFTISESGQGQPILQHHNNSNDSRVEEVDNEEVEEYDVVETITTKATSDIGSDQLLCDEIISKITSLNGKPLTVKEIFKICDESSGDTINRGLCNRILAMLKSDKRLVYKESSFLNASIFALKVNNNNNVGQASKEKGLTHKEKKAKKKAKKDKSKINQKLIAFQNQEKIRIEKDKALVELIISKIIEREGQPHFVKEMEDFCNANGYKSQRKFNRIYSRIRQDERVVYHPSSVKSASFIEGWFTPASIKATNDSLVRSDSINEATSNGGDSLTINDIFNIITNDSLLCNEIFSEITSRDGDSITVGEIITICNASKIPGLIRQGLHQRILDLLNRDRRLVYKGSSVVYECKFTLAQYDENYDNNDEDDDDDDEDDDEDDDDDDDDYDDDDDDDDDDDEVPLNAGGGRVI